MKKTVEITTGAFEKPYRTEAIWSDSASHLKIIWKQKHEGDRAESRYEIGLDKESGICTIRRSGDIRSEMVFDTSKATKGIFTTPYGVMEMNIVTDYINMPSLLAPKFEISYKIEEHMEKNVFSVRIL